MTIHTIKLFSVVFAGYNNAGQRLNILNDTYSAEITKHKFPQGAQDEDALEIFEAFESQSLFVKFSEYNNEIDWNKFPDGGNKYFQPE